MIKTSSPTNLLKTGDNLNGWTIVKVADCDGTNGTLLAKREEGAMKFVTARFNARSLSGKEWYSGFYTNDEDEAEKDFKERSK